jgi:hypothetical protein
VRFTSEGGSLGTGRVSGFGSTQKNGWYGDGAAEWFKTDGYVQTAPESAGDVDIAANDESKTGFAGAGYNHGDWHAGGRLSLYQEERNNGTPVTVNTTSWSQGAAEAGGTFAGGAWTANASGGGQSYFQTFSAIVNIANGPQRTGERLTNRQTTASEFFTGSGQWSRGFGPISVLAGYEGRRTDATIQEFKFSCPAPMQTSLGCSGYVQTGPNFTGGTETNNGV